MYIYATLCHTRPAGGSGGKEGEGGMQLGVALGNRGREGVMGPGVANMKSSVLALLGECILI